MHALAAKLLAIAVAVTAACGPGTEDEPEWAVAFDATTTGWLLNAWGPTDTEIYTVGGEPDSGVVVRFDGTSWQPLELGLEVPLLTWIHGFGPSDITIVGFGGTVIHYDGSSWTTQDTPTDEDLWGVWGASPNNLWAVGGRGRQPGQATLLHYDGNTWTAAEVPPLMRANVNAWFKVWGTAANDIYVVGQRGAVLHYDGDAWTELFVGASDDLISLWGTGPDNIIAVGGRAFGVVTRWDGAEWTTETYPTIPGLNGVWTRTPDTFHAVGALGTVLSIDAATLEPTSERVATAHDFHAVFGAGGDRIVAVGGNLLVAAAPYIGIAYTRDLGGRE